MWNDEIKSFIEWLSFDYDVTATIITLIIYLIFTIFIIRRGGSIWSFIIGFAVISIVLEVVGFSSSINVVTIFVDFIKKALDGIFTVRGIIL